MATKFRYIAQHVSEQVRTFSRVARSKKPLNNLLLQNKMTNISNKVKNIPVLSDTLDHHRQFSNLPKNGEVKRPYTVVVEGNIGSGKVLKLYNFLNNYRRIIIQKPCQIL